MKNFFSLFIGAALTAFVAFAPFLGLLGNVAYSGYALSPVVLVFAEDIYSFQMTLKVPQVLDNSESMGYRKFQPQIIRGTMVIQWKTDNTYDIVFGDLKNRSFKVAKKFITYKGETDGYMISPNYTYIGSNKRNTFTIPALAFYAEFLPSYALSDVGEDNSFLLLIAGKGGSSLKKNLNARIATSFRGYVTGTQGCGCMEYGHVSPTRRAGAMGATDIVVDAVATFGTWRATWKSRRIAE